MRAAISFTGVSGSGVECAMLAASTGSCETKASAQPHEHTHSATCCQLAYRELAS
jgi:hypothetical protein